MKKVIFDIDGVLLSEERYFDVSALTVWEILYSPAYMGLPGERDDFNDWFLRGNRWAIVFIYSNIFRKREEGIRGQGKCQVFLGNSFDCR